MCNAWNHPLNCTCGWGGEGHAGRSSIGGSVQGANWWLSPLTSNHSSFFNPNACCPVCGSPVFFYQSSSGGRVFFDELGPPWPKHPCTDNARAHTPTPREITKQAGSPLPGTTKTYMWQIEGWQPFVIRSVVGIDKSFIKISGVLGSESLVIYIQRLTRHHAGDDPLSDQSVAQLRSNTNKMFELSFLLANGKPVATLAYLLLSDAHEALKQDLRAQKPIMQRPKSGKRPNSTKQPARASKKSISRSLPTTETSLALAFRVAQERQKKPG